MSVAIRMERIRNMRNEEEKCSGRRRENSKGCGADFLRVFHRRPKGHFTSSKSIGIKQGGLLSRSLRPGVPIRPLKRTLCAFHRPISLLYVDVKDNV